jgi:hypothetical protein
MYTIVDEMKLFTNTLSQDILVVRTSDFLKREPSWLGQKLNKQLYCGSNSRNISELQFTFS